jgi:hypothetical protein
LRGSARRYLIDFARGRPTNPARIPVSHMGCWYKIKGWPKPVLI